MELRRWPFDVRQATMLLVTTSTISFRSSASQWFSTTLWIFLILILRSFICSRLEFSSLRYILIICYYNADISCCGFDDWCSTVYLWRFEYYQGVEY
ncbi:unnamed protein product [Brassica napus]|uniref:(rape) hypothetical protein n=1 Tax=Brassica napus TaxID=3708 RepID=A0A817AND2_BRANA|nr:unnamed protein product [Brassica napus]